MKKDLTSINGTVQAYLLNRAGLVDGLLLSDGKQLHLPPHLSAALKATGRAKMARIREQDIDYTVSRGGDDGAKEQPQISNITALLKDRRVLIFAFCAVLFHFANASMLPLVGEVLSGSRMQISTQSFF